MGWEQMMLPSTFERARRREIYARLSRLVTGRPPAELVPLDEVTRGGRLFEQTYVGIRSIEVGRIVGSAGRSRFFDSNFLPRKPEVRERWRWLERTFPEGGFPPIVVYEIGDFYFVVDGHHRVGIARQRKMEFIDAEVTRLRPRFEVPPGTDIGRMIYLTQQRIFLEESGLGRARPVAVIEFSRPHGFLELLELIKAHGYCVMMDRQEMLSGEEIAANWYDCIYLPAVEAIRSEGLDEVFPEATEADLFLWIWERRRILFPERGGMTLEDAARVTKQEHKPRPRGLGRMRPR